MDTTISNPSPVRGSIGDPKVTNVEEALNLSGDSTDSLKENQSENNRSRQSQQNDSALSKSSSQQALVAPNDSSLTAAPLQPHQPTTCSNDSAFHHSDSEDEDESFADCPTFNSPAVNKLLHLGSLAGRQSLGMDALANNLGGFSLDSSIGANSTVNNVAGNVDVKEIEEELEKIKAEVSQHLDAEVTIDLTADVPQVKEEAPPVAEIPEEVPQIVVTESVHEITQEEASSDPPLPSPPPPLEGATEEYQVDEFTYDDVEMMSVVMEEDFSNVPLPEDAVEAFAEEEIKVVVQQQQEQPSVQDNTSVTVVEDAAATPKEENSPPVPEPVENNANVTCQMDVDEEPSPEKNVSLPEEKKPTQEIISDPVICTIPAESPQKKEEEKLTENTSKEQQEFKMPLMMRRSFNNNQQQPQSVIANPFDGSSPAEVEADIKQELFFSSKDFDFLQSKETSNSLSTAIKDSVLLRFDPLINQPVIVVESRATEEEEVTVSSVSGPIPAAVVASDNIVSKKKASQRFSNPFKRNSLEDRIPEELGEEREDSLLEVFGVTRSQQAAAASESSDKLTGRHSCPTSQLVDVTMSLVDINNDSNLSVTGVVVGDKNQSLINNTGVVGDGGPKNKTINNNNFSNINQSTNLEDFECSKLRMSVDGGQQHNQTNGETKIRNERYEDMERKMKEMEEREESLVKRLTEKEKQITKMSHIVEEYERSIAGLMKERAKTHEEYHKRCHELEAERNANYQHLSSLETTFSDLHVKYERSKQQMEALKKSEELLLADKQQALEQAAHQEMRYDKLKTHAMQQMEIANNRLRDDFQASHHEISRLKALLKKEEITRCSLQEQLNQKTKEIEELMKIWDELKSDP